MPRLGVPSTTDSAWRLHATVVGNRPPAAVDKSPCNGRLDGTFPRFLQARIESRERDERKALAAAGRVEFGRAPNAATPCARQFQRAPVSSPPQEVIDFSTFLSSCGETSQNPKRPRRHDRGWDKTARGTISGCAQVTSVPRVLEAAFSCPGPDSLKINRAGLK